MGFFDFQSVGQPQRSPSPPRKENGETGRRSRKRARTAECPCCQAPQPPPSAGGPFPCGQCQRCATSSSLCSKPGPGSSNSLSLGKGTTGEPQPTWTMAPGCPDQPDNPLESPTAQLNPSIQNETLPRPNKAQFLQVGIGTAKLGLMVLI